MQLCYIVVTTYEPSFAEVSIPIEIDASVVLVRPNLSVDPAVDLIDRQLVDVSGDGFEPDVQVRLVQCRLGTCGAGGTYAFTDSAGVLPATPIQIRRQFGGVDCLDQPCAIWAFPYGDFDHVTLALLTFDPNAPLAPPPTVTVDPAADLLDRQAVTVTASGFVPNEYAYVSQCLADLSHCNGSEYAPTDGEGDLSVPFVVRRRVNVDDCAVVDCIIWVAHEGDEATAELDFDESVPPPPVPTVTVTPNVGLSARQVVVLTVHDVGPDAYLDGSLCIVASGCSSGFELPHAVGGESSVSVALPRFFGSSDCAVAACEVRVSVYEDSTFYSLSAPVAFDPGSAPAPPPSLVALPTSGLWDGQRIDLIGAGLLPGEWVGLEQCSGSASLPGRCMYLDGGRADLLGDLLQKVPVARDLVVGSTTFDCLVEDCYLVADIVGGASPIQLRFSESTPPNGGFPTQLECVAWPTGGWPAGEVPSGVDPVRLQQVMDDALAGGTKGIVVIHGGRLVAEGYDPGKDETTIHNSFSVSKTFVATVMGTLADDGLIDMGHMYPFSLHDKLAVISEKHSYYTGSDNPWGKPVIPLEMISVLTQYTSRSSGFRSRGPAVGLFAGQEIRLIKGPLFVNHEYQLEREIIALSESRRTESNWVRTSVYDKATRELVAEVILNSATLKDSYANYAEDAKALGK